MKTKSKVIMMQMGYFGISRAAMLKLAVWSPRGCSRANLTCYEYPAKCRIAGQPGNLTARQTDVHSPSFLSTEGRHPFGAPKARQTVVPRSSHSPPPVTRPVPSQPFELHLGSQPCLSWLGPGGMKRISTTTQLPQRKTQYQYSIHRGIPTLSKGRKEEQPLPAIRGRDVVLLLLTREQDEDFRAIHRPIHAADQLPSGQWAEKLQKSYDRTRQQ